MTDLVSVLRGGTGMLALFAAVLLLRDGFRVRAARYAAILMLSILCGMVATAPDLSDSIWQFPFLGVAYGGLAMLWIFSAAIFDDDFEPSWWHAGAWLSLVTVQLALGHIRYTGDAALGPVIETGFAGLAVWQALSGRAGDLVEARRRFRIVFVLAVWLAILAFEFVVISWLVLGYELPPDFEAIRLTIHLALAFGFGLALLGVTSEGRLVSLLPVPRDPPPVEAPSSDAVAALDERDGPILATLSDVMERQRAYREEGLSVAGLAGKLDLPEYRLRRLINQRLGHRNFTEFLNRYRLADVTQALGDRAQADVPILTIALDAGFGSIGPFNRAFKAQIGVTPTEFRRDRLGQSAQTPAVS
jgi:AraC-like DNA-binding protein